MAELILTGCIRALRKKRGTKCCWDDLDFLLKTSAKKLTPCLSHYTQPDMHLELVRPLGIMTISGFTPHRSRLGSH